HPYAPATGIDELMLCPASTAGSRQHHNHGSVGPSTRSRTQINSTITAADTCGRADDTRSASTFSLYRPLEGIVGPGQSARRDPELGPKRGAVAGHPDALPGSRSGAASVRGKRT